MEPLVIGVIVALWMLVFVPLALLPVLFTNPEAPDLERTPLNFTPPPTQTPPNSTGHDRWAA